MYPRGFLLCVCFWGSRYRGLVVDNITRTAPPPPAPSTRCLKMFFWYVHFWVYDVHFWVYSVHFWVYQTPPNDTLSASFVTIRMEISDGQHAL